MNAAPLIVSIAQSNYLLGDIQGNCKKIVSEAKRAFESGSHLLVTPELSITGYPPEDLLFREAFIQSVNQNIELLCQDLKQFQDLHVIVGHPFQENKKLQNCVSVICNGEVVARYAKQFLPNSEVFDEVRYFTPGNKSCVFDVKGTKVGVIICEDVWHQGPSQQAKQDGAEYEW